MSDETMFNQAIKGTTTMAPWPTPLDKAMLRLQCLQLVAGGKTLNDARIGVIEAKVLLAFVLGTEPA